MKLTEELLKDNIDYYSEIVTIAEDAIISVNEQWEIVFFNDGAEKIFGYTRKESINKPLDMLLPSRFKDLHRKHINIFSGSPEKSIPMSLRKQIFGVRKNGEEFPAWASISKIRINGQWVFSVYLRDVTEYNDVISDLKRSKARLAEAQKIARFGNWDWDISNDSLIWSDEIYRIFGVEPQVFEATYEAFMERIHPDDREPIVKGIESALAGDKTYSLDHRIILYDGKIRFVHEQAEVFFDESGKAVRMIGTIQDITERKLAEERFRLSATVFETSREAILITDPQVNILEANPSFYDITGYSREEVVGKNPQITKSGKHPREFYKTMWKELDQSGRWQGEIWDRRKNGEIYPLFLAISKVIDQRGNVSHYVGFFSDLSALKKSEEQILYLSNYDILTHLPNRVLFRDQTQQAIRKIKKTDQCLAVIFLDINEFKLINDSLGIEAGDELLCLAAKRITDCFSENEMVARLNSDHFVVTIDNLPASEHAALVAEKIINNFSHRFKIKNENVFIDVSLGVAIYPDDGKKADELLNNAEIAVNHAKKKGKNNYQFFSDRMSVDSLERLQLSAELRHALERDEFILYYQPQVDLRTGRIIGAEALIRWKHREKGLMPPAKFISIIEKTGLIIPVGEWVIKTACRQAIEWQNLGLMPLRMSVNLSAIQFNQKNLVAVIKKALATTRLSAEYLELELTESIVMQDVDEAIRKLHLLKNIGVSISIDDFGTGYSSLSYLKKFPIDVLKIDQSFIRDLSVDTDDAAIAAAVISMGHSLNMRIIAEGVEQEEHIHFLREHNCDEIQGHYFSKPLPKEEFVTLLKSGKKLS